MTKNILVLCTGNSARSVLAEAYINHVGQNQWHAYSAGSQPTGEVNPFALAVLGEHGIAVSAPRSKSWDEFAADAAPEMDVVITVCDSAASETCPIWPGAPRTLHWPFADPAAAQGTDDEKLNIFREVFAEIRSKFDDFMKSETETKDVV